MQTLHVLSVLPVPVLPEIQCGLKVIRVVGMINVTLLAGQAVLHHKTTEKISTYES
ncbi:MAG: hypothetical protein GKS07_10330 [Nitrosopumilus sp.]|nr:MAG: hypothetical protein GKS07_10330 [Nitrosopumilus sp.]